MIYHNEIKLKKMKNFIFEENVKRNFASLIFYFSKKLWKIKIWGLFSNSAKTYKPSVYLDALSVSV